MLHGNYLKKLEKSKIGYYIGRSTKKKNKKKTRIFMNIHNNYIVYKNVMVIITKAQARYLSFKVLIKSKDSRGK